MAILTNLKQLCLDHKCTVTELSKQLGFSDTIIYAASSGKWMPTAKFITALSEFWSLDYDDLYEMFERQHKAYFEAHPDYEEHSGFYRHKGWKSNTTKISQGQFSKNTADKPKPVNKKQPVVEVTAYRAENTNTPKIKTKAQTEDLSKVVVEYWHNSKSYNQLCHFLYGKISFEDFEVLRKSASYVDVLKSIYAKVDYDTYITIVNRDIPNKIPK